MGKPQKHTDKQLTAMLQNDMYLIELKEYAKKIERKLLPHATVTQYKQLNDFNETLLAINQSIAEKVAERSAMIMSGHGNEAEQNKGYMQWQQWRKIQNLKVEQLEKAFTIENEAMYLELQAQKEIQSSEHKQELEHLAKKAEPTIKSSKFERLGKVVIHTASSEFKEIMGITRPQDLEAQQALAKKVSLEKEKQTAMEADRAIAYCNVVAMDAQRAKHPTTISPAFRRYHEELDAVATHMQEKAEARKRLYDHDNWKQTTHASLEKDLLKAEAKAAKIVTLKEQLLIDTHKELRDGLISLITDPSWNDQVLMGGVPVVGAYGKKMRVPTGIEAMVRILSGESHAKPNNSNFTFFSRKPAANIENIKPSTHADIEFVKELQGIRAIAIERLTHKRKNSESTQLYRKIVELITDEKLGIQPPETLSKNNVQILAQAKVGTALGLQEVIQEVQARHTSLNPNYADDVVADFINNSL